MVPRYSNLMSINTIAWLLNSMCDTEAAFHHNSTSQLPFPILSNQIQIYFQNILHTTKKLNYLQDLYQQKNMRNT